MPVLPVVWLRAGPVVDSHLTSWPRITLMTGTAPGDIAHRCAAAFNTRDVDRVLACFTPDAVHPDSFYGAAPGSAVESATQIGLGSLPQDLQHRRGPVTSGCFHMCRRPGRSVGCPAHGRMEVRRLDTTGLRWTLLDGCSAP